MTFRFLLLAVVVAFVLSGTPAAADSPSFAHEVRPLLRAHCMKCHGLESYEGNLDLRTIPLILKGGKSGPAIEPGDAAKSLLFKRIHERTMPPAKELPLADDKIELIRRWVDSLEHRDIAPSAAHPRRPDADDEDREFWSFQPPHRPAVPEVRDASRARTPIDHFLLEKLEGSSLTYSPEADRRTLLRRVFLDLIGLPPSPDEIQRFLSDSSERAYEALVDRLLASPRYGERWGRHWLDAAGYVDTIGDDTDAAITKLARGKFLYRDFVVEAFNRDKPFDQFIREQVAGDELVDWRETEEFTPRIRELLIATTFLRSAADETMQTELNTADIRHEVLARTMEVTVHNLLGLTVHCARCHSHKYDPIPQEDYYRLLAFFTPAFNPQDWLQPPERQLPDVPPKVKARVEGRISELQARLESLRAPYRSRLEKAKREAVPEALREDTLLAVQTEARKRSEMQKDLAEKFGPALKVSNEEIAKALSESDRQETKSLDGEVSKLKEQKSSWGAIEAVYDIGAPPATYLLERGNHERPALAVNVGFLSVLEAPNRAETVNVAASRHSSGRRTVLANWLTDRESRAAGLMARVLVNRLWQQLFGRGIVETSDNFGLTGSRPSHPELLDWLAVEFMDSGWRFKSLVQLLVTSTAYRQASLEHAGEPLEVDPVAVDPENVLLWKMPLRQLESEVIRDSVLAVSGDLDRTLGGPAVQTEARPDGFVVIKEKGQPTPTSKWRRSLYILQRRRYHESFLEAFGQPELTTNCTKRTPTAVVSQSLTLMNDRFVFEQSTNFAERVMRDAEANLAARIDSAFELALARRPTPEERRWAADLVTRHADRYRAESLESDSVAERALRHLCHMLLCTNEFLYVH